MRASLRLGCRASAVGARQEAYVRALKSPRPVVVAVGPAGSGKTWLACREAQEQWAQGRVGRILVTRPLRAVDKEDVGFLPGDIDAKYAPWMLPVYDCLAGGAFARHVEVAPLAFMRGRTLSGCFVIADEMQNASPDQLKMLLTRIGSDCKVVITGDPEQCDVETSGLVDLVQRIRMAGDTLEHFELAELDETDVHRHPVVKETLRLYNTKLS